MKSKIIGLLFVLSMLATITGAQELTVPFTQADDGRIYINVVVGSEPLQVLLDSGASEVSLPTRLHKQIHIIHDGEQIVEAFDGRQQNYPIAVATICVASHYRSERVVVTSNRSAAVIPISTLSQMWKKVEFDFNRKILILSN